MRQIYCFIVIVLAITHFAGCANRPVFNPSLAGRFFPLREGSTWTYQIAYANGARETLVERVTETKSSSTYDGEALVVSEYSGFDGSDSLIPANPRRPYTDHVSRFETRYIFDGGYINRITMLDSTGKVRDEEQKFLPQHLWPNLEWSNTVSPFESSLSDYMKIVQHHRSFFDTGVVDAPAGRFANCIRIETVASYQGAFSVSDFRYFISWYAPDVGLVKTLVLSGGRNGHEITRVNLVGFTASRKVAALF